MSTRQRLDDLCAEGRLRRMLPKFPGQPVARDVYVSPDVSRFIHGHGETDKKRLALGAKAEVAIDFIIRGLDVRFALDPHNKRAATQLAAVAPRTLAVFDVRVLDPGPGARVFGCFAAKDCIVLLTFHLRDDLDHIGFDRAALNCRQEWFGLMGRIEPLNGNTHDDFLSEPYTPC